MARRHDDPRAALRVVAERLVGLDLHHPVRVAVDGICGSGKSTFARSLVAMLEAMGRPAVHVDSDGFHHVRARRHRRTDDPARGYDEDAYDLTSLAGEVLRPLGPGGSRRDATAVHDLQTDEVITDAFAVAEPDAVVVVDATAVEHPVVVRPARL